MIYFPLKWAIIYFLLLGMEGVALLLWDRHLAKTRQRKYVSELLLLVVGLLGGAPAMTVTMYVTRHKLHKKKFSVGLPIMTLIHVALLTVMAIFGPTYTIRQTQINSVYLFGYIIVVNLIAAVLTFVDQKKAQLNRRRIKEDTLMLWAGLGGATAMLITMLCFRHKTKHLKFMLGLPIMIVVHVAVLYWLWVVTNLFYFYY